MRLDLWRAGVEVVGRHRLVLQSCRPCYHASTLEIRPHGLAIRIISGEKSSRKNYYHKFPMQFWNAVKFSTKSGAWIMIFKILFINFQIDVRVVHRRSTPPELFRYCMFLKDLVFEFISKSSRKIQQGCRIVTPNFWQIS